VDVIRACKEAGEKEISGSLEYQDI